MRYFTRDDEADQQLKLYIVNSVDESIRRSARKPAIGSGARLTKDRSGSIVTGETGLTHARTVTISLTFDIDAIIVISGCYLKASMKVHGYMAALEDGEDLPIVDDESSNFF